MSLVVPLDSGPLGMVTNPGGSAETLECERWLEGLVLAGADVAVPEIADYEVRRELVSELLKSAGVPGQTRKMR